MTTHAERAEQLLSLATRLASLLEEDIAILRARRPAQLANRQQDRELLMLQFQLGPKATKQGKAP